MSTDLNQVYEDAGKYWNVDPGVLRAVETQESGGNPAAVSPAGAEGSMQLMPATAQAVGVDSHDRVQSIFGAARVLSENLDHFGNLPDALRAYNGGWDKSKWSNKETQGYVDGVASHYVKPTGSDAMPSKPQQQPDTSADDAMWGVGRASSDPQQPEAKGPDTSADDALWGVGSAPDEISPTAAPQGFFSRLGAGIERGAQDVRDTATAGINYADSRVPALAAIDSAIGRPLAQAQALAGQEAQQLADYNQNYGNSLVSSIGRVAGNALATAPATIATAGAINPLVGAAGDAVGGGLLGGGVRLAGAAASGAAQGAAAGAATSTGYGDNALTAAKTGAEMGGAIGAAGKVLSRVVPGTIGNALAGKATPVRAELAKTAIDNYGIPLTAAQVTGDQGSRRLAQAATTMGGGNAHLASHQQAAFNQAVLRTVGVDAPAATQQVMAQARQQIGQKLDDVLSQAPPIDANNQFLSNLGAIENSMQGVPDSQGDAVRRLIDSVRGSANHTGQITPDLYQTLIKHGSPLSRAMGSDDSTLSSAAGEIKDVLDDGFASSLAGAGRSDLLSQWQTARFQYKNLKTIEPIVNKSPEGNISPALLQGRVNVQFGNRAYQGAGDLGQLSDIGQSFLKPLSSSGTPEQGFGLYNLVEGSRAGTQLLHGDVGGAAATAGAMLARPLLAKGANALVGSPALGKAIVARSLGQQTPYTNALTIGGTAIPAVAVGGAVPALNLIAQRNGLVP